MQRILSIGLFAFSFAIAAHAQERKIEISPFAGGYFNSGYQSTGTDFLVLIGFIGPSGTSGEPNSGIFGVRGSHDLTSTLSLEGTFGFSPTGQRYPSEGWSFSSLEDFLNGLGPPPSQAGETYHYTGNILYKFYNRGGWAPFFTAGAGAVTRSSKRSSMTTVIGPPVSVSTTLEPVSQTNLRAFLVLLYRTQVGQAFLPALQEDRPGGLSLLGPDALHQSENRYSRNARQAEKPIN